MIRIELDEASLGATRIAISPLWDAFCGPHLTMPHRAPSRPYEKWVVRPARCCGRTGGRIRGGC